jgi:hypothetical protein
MRRKASLGARRRAATKMLVLGFPTLAEISKETGLSLRTLAKLEEKEARVVREAVDAVMCRMGLSPRKKS